MCFAVCKSLGPVVICILGPWIVTELWKPECLHVCPSPKAVTDLLEMIPVNNNSPSLPNMTTFFPSQYVLWCSLDKLCCRGQWTRLEACVWMVLLVLFSFHWSYNLTEHHSCFLSLVLERKASCLGCCLPRWAGTVSQAKRAVVPIAECWATWNGSWLQEH